MKRREFLAMMVLLPWFVTASPLPQTLGQFGRWGAFRTKDGAVCYAITQPVRSERKDKAYITVSSWPARRLYRQIHVRFRGVADGGAMLSIGERRFLLKTRGADGWPALPTAGKHIARLLREGGVLRATARINGRRTIDAYALAGAASAIDAADLACLRES